MEENDDIQNGGYNSTFLSTIFFIFSSSLTSRSLGSSPRKTKSISEIHEASRRILEEDLIDFVLFSDVDPINFEETSQEKKLKHAMDQEIDSIERNNTWELLSRQ